MIINFWATWCAPCKKEMPSLEQLTFKYPEIKVFAVNTEKPNKIRTRDFFRSVGVTTLNTYYDPQLNLVKTFKLRGLPTSILIDKNMSDSFKPIEPGVSPINPEKILIELKKTTLLKLK